MSVRVTVDLAPFGADPATIGVLEIGNRCPTGQICDYDYRFGRIDEVSGALVFGPWYILRGFGRSRLVWALIGEILARAAAGDEEPSDYSARSDNGHSSRS
jgi:hypothetical protein